MPNRICHGGLGRPVQFELESSPSADYRYFASRYELLTALIIDAYDSLGEAAEKADARHEPHDFTGRWLAVCRAVRRWARRHPHEYTLIYGSPVPGYRAPADTTAPPRGSRPRWRSSCARRRWLVSCARPTARSLSPRSWKPMLGCSSRPD